MTAERLGRLTPKQLVGVVGDLLAMAAQSEHERSKRFNDAANDMESKKAELKREKEARRQRQMARDRAWLEERKHNASLIAKDVVEHRSALVIQSHLKGLKARREVGEAMKHERVQKSKQEQQSEFSAALQGLQGTFELNQQRLKSTIMLQTQWRKVMAVRNVQKLKRLTELRNQQKLLAESSGISID